MFRQLALDPGQTPPCLADDGSVAAVAGLPSSDGCQQIDAGVRDRRLRDARHRAKRDGRDRHGDGQAGNAERSARSATARHLRPPRPERAHRPCRPRHLGSCQTNHPPGEPAPARNALRGNGRRDHRHGPPSGGPMVNGVKTDMVNDRLTGIAPAARLPLQRQVSDPPSLPSPLAGERREGVPALAAIAARPQ